MPEVDVDGMKRIEEIETLQVSLTAEKALIYSRLSLIEDLEKVRDLAGVLSKKLREGRIAINELEGKDRAI
jgi:hypothetical protein